MALKKKQLYESIYHIRILASIILVEFLLIGLFNFWPKEKKEPVSENIVFSDHSRLLNITQITVQGGSPHMPAVPQVPIPVPNDRIIKDPIPNLLLPKNEFNGLNGTGGKGNGTGTGIGSGSGRIYNNPQVPPSVVKIVEPAVPPAAQKADIKVEVEVKFLVDTTGTVNKATIVQIKLYSKNMKSYKIVKSIGYGIPEAAIHAAEQWLFRPARNGGEKVKAYTKHSFTFGI